MDISITFEEALELYNNEEYEEAYEFFVKLAEQENVNAMMQIGYMLFHGHGIPKDSKKAYDWYKKAADKNNASAQYYYAWYCLETEKLDIGKQYLEMAVGNCYREAIYDIAKFYAFGDFQFEKNMQKAIIYYEQACLLKKREACLDLYIACKKFMGKSQAIGHIYEKIGFFKTLKILLNIR